MNKFITLTHDNNFESLSWEVKKSEYLLPDQPSILVDEFTITSCINPNGDVFIIQVLEKSNEVKLVQQFSNQTQILKRKGITGSMMAVIFLYYNEKTIISSSRIKPELAGESRTDAIERIYERLRSENRVYYDFIRDVYYYNSENNKVNLQLLNKGM